MSTVRSTTLPSPAVELWLADEHLPLVHGGELRHYHVAYELAGPADAPVIAVLGGISSHHHPFSDDSDPTPGWWEPNGVRGQVIDTRRYRILGIDYLGGAGLSSGPNDLCLGGVTAIAPGDQAAVLARLIDRLAIPRLEALVGCSYGGMVALEFAARFPARLRTAIVLACAHENHPLASAWRSIQRRVIRLGLTTGTTSAAVAIARGLGIATYRSGAEFGARFHGPARCEDGRVVCPVDSYLDAHGERFAGSFAADAYLRLSESIDLHRVVPEDIRVPTTVIAFDSDQLVPLELARDLARRLAGPARFVAIHTLHGHDGFLKETETVAPLLRRAIEEPPR